MTRYIDVADMQQLVMQHGAARMMAEMADCIREDFLRWEDFDKSPRTANHSANGVIELMPVSDDSLYAFKYVNGHPKNPQQGLTTVMAFGLLAVAGLLIKPVQHAMLNIFAKKATAVMTNVPGPKEQLTMCGAKVTQCMFWVPQSGDIGLGVSILSYGGGVQFGVVSDASLCPEPQAISGRRSHASAHARAAWPSTPPTAPAV